MIFNLFKKKNNKSMHAISTKKFNDKFVGMALDEHDRIINEGDTGTAHFLGKNKIKIVMDSVQDTPYRGNLVLHCKVGDSVYNNFKFIKL